MVWIIGHKSLNRLFMKQNGYVDLTNKIAYLSFAVFFTSKGLESLRGGPSGISISVILTKTWWSDPGDFWSLVVTTVSELVASGAVQSLLACILWKNADRVKSAYCKQNLSCYISLKLSDDLIYDAIFEGRMEFIFHDYARKIVINLIFFSIA